MGKKIENDMGNGEIKTYFVDCAFKIDGCILLGSHKDCPELQERGYSIKYFSLSVRIKLIVLGL